MRFFLPLLLATAPAGAHTGHVADLGGHDHWGIAIGLGVVAGAAALGWLKGRRAKNDDAAEAEPEEAVAEPEGQTA